MEPRRAAAMEPRRAADSHSTLVKWMGIPDAEREQLLAERE